MEAGLFQALLPQAEATAFPVQYLDAIAPPVAEHEELLREGIVVQGLFHEDGQAIDAFAEVDRLPAQVDFRQVIRRAHHDTAAAVFSTRVSVAASIVPPKETAVPLGS